MDLTMSALQVLWLAIMFLAILVEVKTGGTGAGIIFGLVAAGVFWGSQYVKGAADLFQIGLFLGGILCIIVEMLLPTVGLLAGVGVAAMLYSLVMALGGNFAAVTVLILALVAAIGVFALVVNQLPASRLWKCSRTPNRKRCSIRFVLYSKAMRLSRLPPRSDSSKR